MRNWRAVYGQSVPQKTVRNMTTKDNPGNMPINLYSAESLIEEPLDFTVLSEEATDSASQKGTAETLYKISQIVCVKDPHKLFILAVLQDNVYVGLRRVEAKVFIKDPFNPVVFTEDSVRYICRCEQHCLCSNLQ